MSESIRSHFDLEVFRKAYAVSMRVFEASNAFPKCEMFSLTDQVRRSSRSVCANLSEAWRKRRYEAAFIAKLSDAEGEAAETQTWIKYAVDCKYLDREIGVELYREYEEVLRMLVAMARHPEKWLLDAKKLPRHPR